MAKERPALETRKDELRFRLEAGSFALEEAEHALGSGYRVRNRFGFIAFGNIPLSFRRPWIRWKHS